MLDDASPDWIHLHRDGVGLLIASSPGGLPAVVHWGAELGELGPLEVAALLAGTSRQSPPGTLDGAWRMPLLPFEGDGWAGRPGAQLRREGALVYPRWIVDAIEAHPDRDGFTVRAAADGVELDVALRIEPGGLVTMAQTVRNTGTGALEIDWLEAVLPVGLGADTLTSFSGRWTREKVPSTGPLPHGATVRQTRRGRGGHDAPTLFAASVGSPRNRSGELWAVHLAWSGDASYRVDRMPDAEPALGAGELLRPAEIVLLPGEGYVAPSSCFAYSAQGWDGLSARFHRFLRTRASHPSTSRPLTLNTWEAVYFDHDPARLSRLADIAASVGVERFVLDDGWFLGRRDDRRGLGDWQVDRTVWPDGLRPLAAHVHGLGMQFGLWFEPEMVSLDSELARAHPDWLLHHRPLAAPAGVSWRTQHILDLAEPDAWNHVCGAISSLVAELGIDFIKWDHNRDLVEPEHRGRPGTHAQTEAAYRLMRELKARHPGLEIESCSSGGARSDLGVLAQADRIWASDSNDPIERQDIQRWTQLLLPPEYLGSHVGPSPAHSSGRPTPLSFRFATALMGSAGFEWDLALCTPEELAAATRFAALYKELRPIIHRGTAVHAELQDPALRSVGYVLPDASAAVYTVATVASLESALPERIRLHGLDLESRYRIRVRDEIGAARFGQACPQWLRDGETTQPGRVLEAVGLQLPVLWPAQALVLHAVRVASR